MIMHSLPTTAAAGPSAAGVLVPALVIAVLLIGAFAWGSHRLLRRRPPRPAEGAAAERADSWRTPDGEGPRANEEPPTGPGRPGR
ncbi:Secreted protein OS=Kitasatospora aureofaciens OX=1894 GN=HS99_0001100 PE=4 SV=1 [Kitasatospora aureofaciens]